MESFVSVDASFYSTYDDIRAIWELLSIEGLMECQIVKIPRIYPLSKLEIKFLYFSWVVSKPHRTLEISQICEPCILIPLPMD